MSVLVGPHVPQNGHPVHHNESCPMISGAHATLHGYGAQYVRLPPWVAVIVMAHVDACGRCGGGTL